MIITAPTTNLHDPIEAKQRAKMKNEINYKYRKCQKQKHWIQIAIVPTLMAIRNEQKQFSQIQNIFFWFLLIWIKRLKYFYYFCLNRSRLIFFNSKITYSFDKNGHFFTIEQNTHVFKE
jgi:hypothetical protein